MSTILTNDNLYIISYKIADILSEKTLTILYNSVSPFTTKVKRVETSAAGITIHVEDDAIQLPIGSICYLESCEEAEFVLPNELGKSYSFTIA